MVRADSTLSTSVSPGGPLDPEEEFVFVFFFSKRDDKSLRILSQERNPFAGCWSWGGVGWVHSAPDPLRGSTRVYTWVFAE